MYVSINILVYEKNVHKKKFVLLYKIASLAKAGQRIASVPALVLVTINCACNAFDRFVAY